MAAEQIGVPPELCVGYEDAVLGMQAIRCCVLGFLGSTRHAKLLGAKCKRIAAKLTMAYLHLCTGRRGSWPQSM
jgi:beta-phosphoglucomutase-like phosphatase (HAD superfamily)